MLKLAKKIKVDIDSIKETSWGIILLFSILYIINATFINLVVFRSDTLISKVISPIYSITFGLVNGTFIVNVISIIIFIYILVLKFGGLNFFDIGVRKNKLTNAIAVIAMLWVFIQLVHIIIGLIMSGKPAISNTWNQFGVSGMLGTFIGQIFGNALYEEMAFRGFLLVQIAKKFKDRKKALLIGVILSQLMFSLIHIPSRILQGMHITQILLSLIVLFMAGVLFAVVYLVTDNLFLVIGLHTLWNIPLTVVDGPAAFPIIVIFMMLLPIIWERAFERQYLKFKVCQEGEIQS